MSDVSDIRKKATAILLNFVLLTARQIKFNKCQINFNHLAETRKVFMKKSIVSFLISLMCIFNAFAVTEGDLKDVADCMAAISITNVDMELKGDYKNSKLGDKIFASLMTLFYEKLEEYRKSNPNIDSAYLGQMPNRAVAKYSNMGDLQQLKYAQSVLNVNRCFQYAR